MAMHGAGCSYYILGRGVFRVPDYLMGPSGGCPLAAHAGDHGALAAAANNTTPAFKFGFMSEQVSALDAESDAGMIKALEELGEQMNGDPAKPGDPAVANSKIPAGYTYLGQFIAHEITNDAQSSELPDHELNPTNTRSPVIDLDSLYGAKRGDPDTEKLYDPGFPALLKVGKTWGAGLGLGDIDYDLFRDADGKAVVGDERNDENLVTAQLHLALIYFHNNVVKELQKELEKKGVAVSVAELFARAREEVTRHFQWIVLKDFLPQIVKPEILAEAEQLAKTDSLPWCREKENLYMPLEFSAAAFRLGHSMVRGKYQWNLFHSTAMGNPQGGAALSQLFTQTEFSGRIGKPSGPPRLPTDWVVDWRRFFKFTTDLIEKPVPTDAPNTVNGINVARKIDTNFDLHLDTIDGFNHHSITGVRRKLAVRNLLRGHALGLSSGEEMADAMKVERLDENAVISGYEKFLSQPMLEKNTPLWFYILKEAESQPDDCLGPLGSTIVAQALTGIIRYSPISILDGSEWFPTRTKRGVPGTKSAQFEMVDLLKFAGVINPLEGM